MKREVLILLCLLLITPFASAELFISQPKSIYNLEDEFAFNITIIPSSDVSNFLSSKIICGVSSTEVYKVPLSLKSGVQKVTEIAGRFDNFLVGDLKGTCNFRAEYGLESANTPSFEITEKIYVNLWTNKVILEPNDRFTISGKANKKNGQLADGFVELRIEGLDATSFKSVENGQFDILMAVEDDAPAGDYNINARVYEKDGNGKITNNGESNTAFRIKQILRKSEIALSSQNTKPGDEFSYTLLLYDQSNKEILENVEISIYNQNGELFAKEILTSGEANTLEIGSNFLPGSWKIESKIGEIGSERMFNVEEFEDISFKLAEGTLTVTNTGNVPYAKSVEIIIGDTTSIEEVNLDVGESKRYALSAPDGEYKIEVNEGSGKQAVGTSLLTGRAISVNEEGSNLFLKSFYLLMWFLLIGFGSVFAIKQYRKIAKTPHYGETPSKYPAPIKLNESGKNIIAEGKREECAVIALRIKNSEEIEKNNSDAMSAIERALTRARDARAKIYSDKNYRTAIFSPTLTRGADCNLKAVAIAGEIERILIEHNKKFGEKIMFGLGVHNGEMIVEFENGNFKFNSIGSTMPYVKKISESINSGTGISEMVHRKILGKVKSDKIEGTNYWRLRRVIDHDKNSEFISKFVERQRRDAKKT